jgi:hypothetical protein
LAARIAGGTLLVLALGACAGPMGLTGGESVRVLEPPAPTLTIAVVAADDSTALPATLTVFGEDYETDETGHFTVEWPEPEGEVTVAASAPGFREGTAALVGLPEEGELTLALDPVVLSGQVVSPDGRALPGTEVKLGSAEARTDDAGSFEINRAVPGDIALSRPAWETAVVTWDGAETDIELTLQPRMIRALRVAGDKAGDRESWNALLDLADETGVNAFVVDTKAEGGTVFHDTDVSLAHEIGAVRLFYDLDKVIQDMDDRGLYKITRIVTFQDNFLAKERPEIAALDKETGEPWKNNKGIRWLDPTDRDSWKYPLALAEEACRRGFDEIQFDYIRFPSDGPISKLQFDDLSTENYYGEEAQQTRIETIAAFLEEAHSRLNPMGCAVAADIFAITLESRSDEGIGQSPRVFSNYIDVLSPMIYTYTYGSGWAGCEVPNDCAELIVERALDAGIPKLEGFSVYRPWLQRAFIPAEEILAIQKIAEDRDMGWMLWSANTLFDSTHLPPAES